MRQPSLVSSLLLVGFLLLGLWLLNLYLLQPRLALKLAAPTPLPTIEEMLDSPHGEQVATTMSLIKSMATVRRQQQVRGVFHPHQGLRNPFIDPNSTNGKERENRSQAKGDAGVEKSRPQVQMVMIGEVQSSALLDNVLVKEGDRYKNFTVLRIIESGVYIKDNDKVFKLPLGAYSTVSLLDGNDKSEEKSETLLAPASLNEKAVLSELLQRLQPLLDGEGKQTGNRKQLTNVK